MWEAPNALALGDTRTMQDFFAISKQLCYARPGWQSGSNGHPLVRPNEKMVDTLDDVIQYGAPVNGKGAPGSKKKTRGRFFC